MTQTYFEDVNVGDEIPKLKKNCSTQQLVLWAAGSGDFYQIHYDKDFAQRTGLKGLIVHGALKNAFLGQLLHDWAGENGQVPHRLLVARYLLDHVGDDDAAVTVLVFADVDTRLLRLPGGRCRGHCRPAGQRECRADCCKRTHVLLRVRGGRRAAPVLWTAAWPHRSGGSDGGGWPLVGWLIPAFAARFEVHFARSVGQDATVYPVFVQVDQKFLRTIVERTQ